MEVSANHNIPIVEVIRGKFTPSIRLLIMYYNNKFRTESKEIEKMEKELEKTGGET